MLTCFDFLCNISILQCKITLVLFYSALCLMNLTIRNGSPKPLLKYIASKAVNLYLLNTSNGKLEPGPPYGWLCLTAVVEKLLISLSPLKAIIFLPTIISSVRGRNEKDDGVKGILWKLFFLDNSWTLSVVPMLKLSLYNPFELQCIIVCPNMSYNIHMLIW